MKVLIIASGIGEKILLTTPAIRSLKTELDAEVHILLEKEFAWLLQLNPYLDQIHEAKTPFFSLRRVLKKQNFDSVIDLKNTLSSKALRTGLTSNILSFNNQRAMKWLYTKAKINKLSKVHLTDQYLSLLEPIGVKGDSLGIDFFIPEKDEVEKEWLPKTHSNGYAAITLSASHFTKRLPANRLIELCDRINKPIILIGESRDEEIAHEIEVFFKRGTKEEEKAIEGLNKKSIIFNACGKFNINQSASLVKNANWVFAYDDVLMHIASAFKKPIFSIWGNTTPFFGTYPYRTQFTVFENNKLSCRPCSKTGYNNCPKGHFKCMNEMTFDFYLPD